MCCTIHTSDARRRSAELRYGLTGLKIGTALAQQGITVAFMTGNPDLVSSPVPGAVGVIAKPVCAEDIRQDHRFRSRLAWRG